MEDDISDKKIVECSRNLTALGVRGSMQCRTLGYNEENEKYEGLV